eukprot:COSAG01_NODE_439_length_17034_cov_5.326484_9_plen_84_part_00
MSAAATKAKPADVAAAVQALKAALAADGQPPAVASGSPPAKGAGGNGGGNGVDLAAFKALQEEVAKLRKAVTVLQAAAGSAAE